ncbi:MAG: SH3 domain-containing protein [Micavibrio sp.]
MRFEAAVRQVKPTAPPTPAKKQKPKPPETYYSFFPPTGNNTEPSPLPSFRQEGLPLFTQNQINEIDDFAISLITGLGNIIKAITVGTYGTCKKAIDRTIGNTENNPLYAGLITVGILTSPASIPIAHIAYENYYIKKYPVLSVYTDKYLQFHSGLGKTEKEAKSAVLSKCAPGFWGFLNGCNHILTIPAKTPACISIAKNNYQPNGFFRSSFKLDENDSLAHLKSQCANKSPFSAQDACGVDTITYFCNSTEMHKKTSQLHQENIINDEKIRELKKQFHLGARIQMGFGIGANFKKEGDYIRIVGLDPKGPGAQKGLKIGDTIIKIYGNSMRGKSVKDIYESLLPMIDIPMLVVEKSGKEKSINISTRTENIYNHYPRYISPAQEKQITHETTENKNPETLAVINDKIKNTQTKIAYVVTASALNVRNSPSLSGEIIGKTTKGSCVISSGQNKNGFIKIEFKDKSSQTYTGYSSIKYLSASKLSSNIKSCYADFTS